MNRVTWEPPRFGRSYQLAVGQLGPYWVEILDPATWRAEVAERSARGNMFFDDHIDADYVYTHKAGTSWGSLPDELKNASLDEKKRYVEMLLLLEV